MVNLVLGVLIGIAGSRLYTQPLPVPWFAWALFAMGSTAIVLAFDVLIGSLKENQPRAAWMGLGMFGGLGLVMIFIGYGLAF